MNKKLFFLNPLVLLSSLISGCIVMFNWSARHPYLVFFEHKFLMILRYGLAILAFYFFFSIWRSLLHYCTQKASPIAKKFFFQADLLTYLLLGPLLLRRYFIPGRSEGNRYYLMLFLSWFALKIALVLLFFDRKTLKQMPKKTWYFLKNTFSFLNRIFQKQSFNSIYLLFFLGAFIGFETLYVLSLPKVSLLSGLTYGLFFFSFLIFVHAAARAFLPKIFHTILTYCSFLILICAFLDYFSFQMVNLHMSGSLSALVADGLRNIPQTLEGADVKISYFILCVLLTLTLPLLGVFVTRRLPQKNFKFSAVFPFILGISSLGGCYYSDSYIQKKLSPISLQALIKSHPIKPFFLKNEGLPLSFNASLSRPPSQEDLENALNLAHFTKEKKPHIFFFVIESFRDDYLTEETAPFLSSLKKSSPHFKLTASNANVTHCSLFTLYTGLYPHHWITLRDENFDAGGLPLRVLKKAGYNLHACHSSYFKYFNIGETLFGKNYSLLDTLYEAKHLSEDVAQRDQMAITKSKELLFSADLTTPQYVTILLDSTHHHYYFPENFETPFKPYLKAFNYANRGKQQLLLTKNRYRNAIYYVDSLIKDFCDHLKELGIYEDSILVITGDHAEEFMEFGHYFHGTDLCLPQSHVPIIYKFPKDYEVKKTKSVTSHVDIYPTLFDCLHMTMPPVLDGNSIFSKSEGYILSFRPQYKKNPYQFYLHNGSKKIEASFENAEDIYRSRKIKLMAIKDLSEQEITSKTPTEDARELFNDAFKSLFK